MPHAADRIISILFCRILSPKGQIVVAEMLRLDLDLYPPGKSGSLLRQTIWFLSPLTPSAARGTIPRCYRRGSISIRLDPPLVRTNLFLGPHTGYR
jgi:hypothetical protein